MKNGKFRVACAPIYKVEILNCEYGRMRKKWFCKEKMGKVGVKRMLKSVRGIIKS